MLPNTLWIITISGYQSGHGGSITLFSLNQALFFACVTCKVRLVVILLLRKHFRRIRQRCCLHSTYRDIEVLPAVDKEQRTAMKIFSAATHGSLFTCDTLRKVSQFFSDMVPIMTQTIWTVKVELIFIITNHFCQVRIAPLPKFASPLECLLVVLIIRIPCFLQRTAA